MWFLYHGARQDYVWHSSREDINICVDKWSDQHFSAEGRSTRLPRLLGTYQHDLAHHPGVKKSKKNLAGVSLDLANAYGSVPHSLIEFAMEFLWIPYKVRKFVMQYYKDFRVRFFTQEFTARWQNLDVGIRWDVPFHPSFLC